MKRLLYVGVDGFPFHGVQNLVGTGTHPAAGDEVLQPSTGTLPLFPTSQALTRNVFVVRGSRRSFLFVGPAILIAVMRTKRP